MSGPSVFGERLRETRDNRDMSQAELAKKSGLDKAVISHFETGERQFPSAHNLRKIAEALNVKTDYLLGIVEEEESVGGSLTSAFRNFENEASDDDIETIKTLMEGILNKKNK